MVNLTQVVVMAAEAEFCGNLKNLIERCGWTRPIKIGVLAT